MKRETTLPLELSDDNSDVVDGRRRRSYTYDGSLRDAAVDGRLVDTCRPHSDENLLPGSAWAGA
jgi:hypothetical protein